MTRKVLSIGDEPVCDIENIEIDPETVKRWRNKNMQAAKERAVPLKICPACYAANYRAVKVCTACFSPFPKRSGK